MGGMSAVGILMLCYRGWYFESDAIDRVIGVADCVAALTIANLPCCERLPYWYKWGHGAGAIALFVLLASLLLFRFTDRTEDTKESKAAFAYRRKWVEDLLITYLPGFKEATDRRLRKSGTGLTGGPGPVDDVAAVVS